MEKNYVLKRGLQFSISALLLIALWFASSAAGYNRGFRNGYQDGKNQRELEEPYFARYSLYDVLPKSFDPANPTVADFDTIIVALMQQTTESWASAGGLGECFVDHRQASVVIYNEDIIHRKFAKMLKEMPKNRDVFLMPNDGRYGVIEKP